MRRFGELTILFALFLGACAPILPREGGGGSTPIVMTGVASTAIAGTVLPAGTEVPFLTPEPPTAIPTLPLAALSLSELKYKVLEQFPDFFFCDPDFYPVARDDEMSLARERFPELQADQEEFQAVLSHTGLSGLTTFTDDQKLLIYREHKKLNAVNFEPAGVVYQFQIQTGQEGGQGVVVKGTIDGRGSIDVQERSPGFLTCPICLAAGTLIDTPRGAEPVEDLHMGDLVWTMNAAGEKVVGKILKFGSVRVPSTHQVVHIRLSDGRELWASPGHPTADGRWLGALRVGERLDGAHITLVERIPYQGSATYDLLPEGATGYYWANGILMGSTLRMP